MRPKLDYCIQAWRPHLKRDNDLLERVQRRATRMVEECRGVDYEGRLRYMKLTTLETRRIRADLVEVYKIINEKEGLFDEDFCRREKRGKKGNKNGGTRGGGNRYKLYKKRFRPLRA